MKIKKILISIILLSLFSGGLMSGMFDDLKKKNLKKELSKKKKAKEKSLKNDLLKQKELKLIAELTKEIEQMQKDIIAGDFKFNVKINDLMKLDLLDLTGLSVPKKKKKRRSKKKRKDISDKKFADDLREHCNSKAKSFDWRDYNIVPPIKQQGKCGSCYMFSAMASYESGYRLFYKKNIDVSEQHFLDCRGTGKCQGGWYGTVFEKMMKAGGMEEGRYPYSGKNSSCKVKSGSKYYSLNSGNIGRHLKMAKVSQIKEGLCKHGVLSTTVYVSRMFTAYSGGIFDENKRKKVNHAVNIVGWDDSKKSWLIRNSWGTKWGENGYMWIEYGSNNIGFGTVWVSPRELSE